MSMIFPGMDPYLEDPQWWQGFHNRLIVYIADHLRPQLRPRYVANLDARVYLSLPEDPNYVLPDVTITRPSARYEPIGPGASATVLVDEADAPFVIEIEEQEFNESFLKIIDMTDGRRVVTVIEVLSPTNKRAGDGRDAYKAKQKETLKSRISLVEIDLLRSGPHTLAVPKKYLRGEGHYHYMTSVLRAVPRPKFELYATSIRDRLPRIKVPLAKGDADVILDIQEVVAKTYEAGDYRGLVDYQSPSVPPLAPADRAWAAGLIRGAARRDPPPA